MPDPAPPALSVKRSSRRAAAGPYSDEAKASSGNTGLTNELKQNATLDWEPSSAAAASSSSAKPGKSGRLGAMVKGTAAKVSKKALDVFAAEPKERPAEIIECMLERPAGGGAFGMGLNDHNRVTALDPGLPAEKAGLQVFDRIVKVDGRELRGKLEFNVAHRAALSLTIERPARAVYSKIVEKESKPGSSPYGARAGAAQRRGRRGGGDADADMDEEHEVEADEEGKESLTLTVTRDAASGPLLGLQISNNNYILAVTVGSSGDHAGLKKARRVRYPARAPPRPAPSCYLRCQPPPSPREHTFPRPRRTTTSWLSTARRARATTARPRPRRSSA